VQFEQFAGEAIQALPVELYQFTGIKRLQ